MLTIGDFARLGGVTSKQLRFLDQRGLFAPAWSDPSTGYRWYSPAQLPTLYRIVALRDLGVGVDELAEIVERGDDLFDAIQQRRDELEAERARIREQLSARGIRVDGARACGVDVVVGPAEAAVVATRRVTLGRSDSPAGALDALTAAVERIVERARRPAGAIVRSMTSRRIEVDLAVPVTARFESTDDIGCVEFEAATVATTIHRTGLEGLGATTRCLAEWVEDRGHHCDGPARLVWLQQSDAPKAFDTVEVHQPVELARLPGY